MYILGISAFYHDSAACLIYDGTVIAAAQEERFTRKKHDAAFPHFAIRYCLEEAGISANEVVNIVFYEKPFVKFERLIETYLAFAPRGFRGFSASMPVWIKEKLFQKSILTKELSATLGGEINWRERLLFSEHHLSHAASAFYPSPFENAVVLTLDGVGEWTTTSLAIGKANSVEIIKKGSRDNNAGIEESVWNAVDRIFKRYDEDGSGYVSNLIYIFTCFHWNTLFFFSFFFFF